jgi:hypothetical protein
MQSITPLNRPLIFLDLDDVLCLNSPYGGYDVVVKPHPMDLWEKLFSQEAIDVLLDVVREHRPRIVLTTSWLMLLDREGFEGVFRATGLLPVAECLHEQWEAPQKSGMSRLQAVEHWLERFHAGEPFVVLDDHLSGSGLKGSEIDDGGRLVLCDVGVGLRGNHVAVITHALCS